MAAEGGTAPVPARRWRAPVWHREQPLGPGGNRRARPAAEGAGRLAVTPAGLGFAPEAVSDRAGRIAGPAVHAAQPCAPSCVPRRGEPRSRSVTYASASRARRPGRAWIVFLSPI